MNSDTLIESLASANKNQCIIILAGIEDDYQWPILIFLFKEYFFRKLIQSDFPKFTLSMKKPTETPNYQNIWLIYYL